VITVLYIGCPLAAVLLAALVYTIYRRKRVRPRQMAISPGMISSDLAFNLKQLGFN
jgi:cytochrome c-type biogenesis protein CcmH/NrfF